MKETAVDDGRQKREQTIYVVTIANKSRNTYSAYGALHQLEQSNSYHFDHQKPSPSYLIPDGSQDD